MGWLSDLQKVGSGLYVWAVPDQPSVLKLNIFQVLFPDMLDYENTTDYHATVLHCRDMGQLITSDSAEACIRCPLRGFAARAVPTVWKDKDRWILVMALDAPELAARNRQLQATGLQHSFPEYSPHVTLGKVLGDPKEVRSLFRQAWSDTLAFEPQLKYSFCC